MSQPITWQNIIAPNNMDASQQMTAATNSFNNAFSGLQGALRENDVIEAKKFDKQKILNTQSYLNQVDELGKTPEQLQAAIQSGALDNLRKSFGDNIDHAAVRGAGEALLNQRYQQAKAATEYNHMATDERAAPFAEGYKAALIRGDEAGAAEFLAKATEAGYRKPSELAAAADIRGQQLVERGRDTTKFNQGTATHEASLKKTAADIVHMANQDATSRIQASAAAQSVAQQGKLINAQIGQMDITNQERKEKRELELKAAAVTSKLNSLNQMGNVYAEGKYTGKQADELSQLMVKSGIGDNPSERAKIIERFKSGTIKIKGPDGKEQSVDIPYSALKAAILGSTDQWINMPNQGWANEAEKNLKAALETTYTITDDKGNAAARNKAVDDQLLFDSVMNTARQTPSVKSPAGISPSPTQEFKKKVMGGSARNP